MFRLTIFVLLLVLVGCKQEKIQEKVKTVEWYKENPLERKQKIEECSNNPGLLEETPNCKNAQKAQMTSMTEKPASNW